MQTNPNGQSARVVFQPNGRQGDVPCGITLLDAARALGVEIESICGGRQTCGKCKVAVEGGHFAKFGITSADDHLTEPDARERDYAAQHGFQTGMRLSCACQVTGDLVIRVPEESQTRKQVVRKAAGVERAITVDAAMRLYYVELPPAELKDHRGDWERLRDELHAVHELPNLSIDLPALRALQPALAQDRRRVTVTVWSPPDQETATLPADGDGLRAPARRAHQVIRIQPGFHDDIYGAAVDVGTTTMAVHLCHLRTGEILAGASRMNPQVVFGEDLMSRVSYAMLHDDGTDRMRDTLVDGLNELLSQACQEAGIAAADLVEMVVVGNTTMHHLLLGINPQELGGSPFSLAVHSPVDVKARDLGLEMAPGANVHIPPCEAGHVGADNVGVLVAEAPYNQEQLALIIDIGTNGEILLGNREQVLSASSPTGPAFEGAQIRHGMRAADGAIERVRIDPATLDVRYRLIGREEWVTSPVNEEQPEESQAPQTSAAEARRARRDALLNPALKPAGICGSGVIEAIAELFLAGVVAPNGRFVPVDHPRLRTGLGEGGGKAEFVLAWPHETATGSAVTVHSDDIRAIQLAKAALYAGAKLLMQRMELTDVDKVVLAGGFGSYIDPVHAMILGLIPDCELSRVSAVGNAAGDGARMILLDRRKRQEAVWAARWATYIETAVEPTFQEEFVGAIEIPHAQDPFPHLAPLLEKARSAWPEERRQAVEAMRSGGRPGRASRADRAARRERIRRRES